jgi:hypothetical protein
VLEMMLQTEGLDKEAEATKARKMLSELKPS